MKERANLALISVFQLLAKVVNWKDERKWSKVAPGEI